MYYKYTYNYSGFYSFFQYGFQSFFIFIFKNTLTDII